MDPRLFTATVEKIEDLPKPKLINADQLLTALQDSDVLRGAYLLEEMAKDEQGLAVINEAYTELKRAYDVLVRLQKQFKFESDDPHEIAIQQCLEFNEKILEMLQGSLNLGVLRPDILALNTLG